MITDAAPDFSLTPCRESQHISSTTIDGLRLASEGPYVLPLRVSASPGLGKAQLRVKPGHQLSAV